MVVPQAFTQPVYVTVTKAIGYAGASGFSVWWRLLVTAHDPWPVDWIGAVVADGVELPDGCRHTDRISAMLTPR
jgi:hypothetical protein